MDRPGESADPERILLAEIAMESSKFYGLWTELVRLTTTERLRPSEQPLSATIRRWAMIEGLLGSGARIHRLLDPTEGASGSIAPTGRSATRMIRARMGGSEPDLGELARARELLDRPGQGLSEFLEAHPDRRIIPFSIGSLPTGPVITGHGPVVAMRKFEPSSGRVVVFDQELNLRRMAQQVRALRGRLPRPGVRLDPVGID